MKPRSSRMLRKSDVNFAIAQSRFSRRVPDALAVAVQAQVSSHPPPLRKYRASDPLSPRTGNGAGSNFAGIWPRRSSEPSRCEGERAQEGLPGQDTAGKDRAPLSPDGASTKAIWAPCAPSSPCGLPGDIIPGMSGPRFLPSLRTLSSFDVLDVLGLAGHPSRAPNRAAAVRRAGEATPSRGQRPNRG